MKKVAIYTLLALVLVVPTYKLKSRMHINLIKDGQHTPDKLEKWSGGLIKASWIDDINFIRRPK